MKMKNKLLFGNKDHRPEDKIRRNSLTLKIRKMDVAMPGLKMVRRLELQKRFREAKMKNK